MSPEEPNLGDGPTHSTTHSARLLISCPDGPGIVAAVGSFLYDVGANIVSSDQYSTHPERGSFFMRVTFFLPGLVDDRQSFVDAFDQLPHRFAMDWRISYAGEPKRAVLMASREDHCLTDLLWRHRRGELDMELLGVISNHDDLRVDVETLGIPYHHVPVTRDTKPAAEAAALQLIAGRAEGAGCRSDNRPGRAARRPRLLDRGPDPGRARRRARHPVPRAAQPPRRPRARA
jgi:formyltetrahydrofolate deformylase